MVHWLLVGGAIDLGGEGLDGSLDLLELLLEGVRIRGASVLLDPVAGLLQDGEDLLLVVLGKLATESLGVTDLSLHAPHEVLKRVEGLDLLAVGLILGGELLGLLDHALDVLLSEATLRVGDLDGFGLARALVDGADLQDTVGVDLEGDVDLGDAARCRGNAVEVELAEKVVVLGKRALTLEHLDGNGGLVVGGGGERLGLLGGDDGITGNDLGEDTTGGLDTQGEGADVDEEDVTGAFLAGEDTTLEGSAPSDSLIGVDTLGGFLAVEEVLEEGLDLGNTGRATNKDDLNQGKY